MTSDLAGYGGGHAALQRLGFRTLGFWMFGYVFHHLSSLEYDRKVVMSSNLRITGGLRGFV